MTREQLRAVREWKIEPYRATSLYLNVDGRHRTRPEYEAALKNLVTEGREKIASASSDREVQQSLERDLERMQQHVSQEFRSPQARGLALFSCAGAGLWQQIETPMPVRDRVVLAAAPYLRPLEAMVDEHHSFGVILSDSRRARLFLLHMGELQEFSVLEDEVPTRAREGGSSARSGSGRSRVWQGTSDSRIDRHIDWHVHQHLDRVAQAALELYNQEHFGHLMLGGPDELVAELEGLLHSYLQKILVGRFSVRVNAPAEEIKQLALELEQEYDSAAKREKLHSLLEKAGSRSFGVVGLADTLAALAMGAVHTLVVEPDFAAAGQRCQGCGALNPAQSSTCLACGGNRFEEVSDLVAEAIEDAIEQRCEIVRVGDAEALARAGHIGAILRFKWWETAGALQAG